jgi:hypothetical protein
MLESPLGYSWPFLAFAALTAGLFLFVAIGHARRGPTPAVKKATLLLVLAFAALWGLQSGVSTFFGVVVGLPAAVACTVTLALSTWRHPRRKKLERARPDQLPEHARKTLERWTAELVALGFRPFGDFTTSWAVQGKTRLTFVRFLEHHDDGTWLELHALSEPKVVARQAVSDKGDGCVVVTCDQLSDSEVLGGLAGPHQRVRAGTSCRDLVDRHRALAQTSGGSYRQVDDPAAAHVRLYDAWIDGLLQAGRIVEREPGQVGIAFPALPSVLLRTQAAWLS